MKYTLKSLVLLLFLLLCGSLFFRPATRVQAALVSGNTIADGVWMGDIDLSGKTLDEAKALLEEYFREVESSILKIYVYDNYLNRENPGETEGQTLLNSFFVPFGDLGFDWSVEDTLKEAVSYGQSGRLIERYKHLQDMKFENKRLPLDFSVSLESIQDYITKKISPEVNHAATDAQVSVSYPNVFVSAAEKIGYELDVAATAETIWALFEEGIPEDPICNATISYLEPEHRSEDFAKMNAVLGEFTTTVELGEAKKNRNHNIALEMDFFDGTILMPGEVFSAFGSFGGDTTKEKGFLPAGTFVDGTLRDEDGGGVCQGSTTMYNAALFAEMEIVERFAHSMVISYVPLAQDCALYYGGKDLKFKNNTDAPVYIEAFMKGDKVVARIYGHETRPANRKLVFETTYVERVEYGPKYSLRSDLNPGKPEVSGDIHMAAKAYCTKKVLQDGMVISSEKIANDTYNKEMKKVTLGTNTLFLEVRQVNYTDVPIDPNRVVKRLYEKIYDKDGNQILVDQEGVPIYDGNGGYLLVKNYETDHEGRAKYDGSGKLIARYSPIPRDPVPSATTAPTASQPEPSTPSTDAASTDVLTIPEYKNRSDVSAYVKELTALGFKVSETKTVKSDSKAGDICWVSLTDGSTDVSPGNSVPEGSKLVVYVSGGKDYDASADTTEAASTTQAATTAAPTEPLTEAPTEAVTEAPTEAPTEPATTAAPTEAPTEAPTTAAPTEAPTTAAPTEAPTTPATTESKPEPSTEAATQAAPASFPLSDLIGLTVQEGITRLAQEGIHVDWTGGLEPQDKSKAIITNAAYIDLNLTRDVYLDFTED